MSFPTLLIGPASLDTYPEEGVMLPGGGCLNIAWHWSKLGFPAALLTRIGRDEATLFTEFFERHGISLIRDDLVQPGRSAAIDVTINEDGTVWMDNFVPGVWEKFRVSELEQAHIARAARVYLVLVGPVLQEFRRLGRKGVWERPFVSVDLLDFRHLSAARLANILPFVDLCQIGWPGRRDDSKLQAIIKTIKNTGRMAVVTLGAAGVLTVDPSGRERFFPVDSQPVSGSTVGCGDAFAAYFLAQLAKSRNFSQAIAAGSAAGTQATTWRRPLPEEAYG